jgi:TetR/AcrR family transcriptional repressor of nem operon
MSTAGRTTARDRLIAAAIELVRARGFAATSVDDLCRTAGVTKGAFFHHFASKEALGAAAAEAWSVGAEALFAAQPYRTLDDPLARLLGYVDFRRALIAGPVAAFSCYAGTALQEAFGTSEPIRAACGASIIGHAATLEADIAAAMERHGVRGCWSAASLARHTQCVLQGAFILAKASGDPAHAIESIDHLRRYVELLFGVHGAPPEGSPS